MKNFLGSDPVLAIFDPELPIHIYIDASLQGIGAVLKQPQLNEFMKKPVACFSKKLHEVQKKVESNIPRISTNERGSEITGNTG